ncbi:28S ribosomal protein S18c, mitochondrial [Lamellibrachia satsuma]|nr:28S ribosomal protein S18c, mitochondrial [Lamellibrachia satsuma]
MASNVITKNFCTRLFPVFVRNTQYIYEINTQSLLSNKHVAGCSAPVVRTVKTIVLHKDIIKKQQEETFCQEHHLEEQQQEKTQDYGDLPIPNMPNPYEKPARKCLLCEHKLDLDYKNVRLLSQFVSPYTGEIYGRHVNGLCIYMQRRIAILIKRARYFGLMSYTAKDPKYLRDPKLFDPFKRH